jgi:IS5 family transposase
MNQIDRKTLYRRLGKQALIKQGRYAHAKQHKRVQREMRRIRTYLGRVIRNINWFRGTAQRLRL